MLIVNELSVEKYPNITDILEVWAKEKANKVCLQQIDRKAYTYKELNEEITSLAKGFQQLGISKGSIVLTMLDTGMECVEAWLALNKLGAIDVPVHTAYKSYFINHIFKTTNSRFLVVNAEHLEIVLESIEGISNLTIIVVGETTIPINKDIEIISYGELKKIDSPLNEIAVSAEDPASILFTSGTKSGTKGVVLTNRTIRNQMLGVAENMKINENDIAYVCVPMSHGNGKFAQVGVSLMLGASAVMLPKFSASRWIHDITKYNITYTSLMGPMAEFVYKQEPTIHDRNNKLRIILNIPRDATFTPKFEKRFGVKCVEVYGQSGIVSPMRPVDDNYASCGKLKERYWEARIVNTVTGKDAEVNQPGELWIRPKKEGFITPGYFNDPESFEKAFHEDWFMTGDLLRRDKDGYYYFIGRTGAFIRRRGENVSAMEVESILKKHDTVKDAAVFGVPTEFSAGEEDIMAVVDGKNIDYQSLIQYCEKELPFFAIPKYWLAEQLPRLSDGTVDKELLQNRGVTKNTFKKIER